MVGSMLLAAACFLLVVIRPAFWTLGASLALIALLKVIYDPAMQAYVGDNVPYERRGKAIAITEFSWAGAFLVGTPLLSLAIARQGWPAPFAWLGAFSVGAALLLWRRLPPTRGRSGGRGQTWGDTLLVLRQQPVIWAASAYMMLLTGSNEMLFIVYGGWMESRFGLSLIALGISTTVVGGAEIVGELAAGWSVDRFGKRPVILCTALLNGIFCFLLPFTAGSLGLALAGYFALFLFFEITVVGGIPLMTEIVPSARGVVMTMMLAAGALGRAMGAAVGPWLFARYTFIGNGVVAALTMVLAILILFIWVREGRARPAVAKNRENGRSSP
jgi:predicted MFS family arabinose efflux permease